MRLSLEGFGMSEEHIKQKGLEAFIRAHQTSGSVGEAAEKLGIDEIKYKKRLSVYNHRLKKMGYLPLERHDKKITSTEKALQSLEAEGLLQRAPERPKKEWEKRLERATQGVRNLNSPVQTSIFGED
jgi:hypothetical protein